MAGNTFIAGAASVDLTPSNTQFLFGYPHVERYSTGVHDPLLSSALYMSDGENQVLFSANDLIFIPRDLAARARFRIQQATGIPAENMVITATHTHSGPITVDYMSNAADHMVPRADGEYLQFMEDEIVRCALEAIGCKQAAMAGLAVADATGIGTNRRDPSGPADLDVPILLLRSQEDNTNIAAMLVCCMHPTVLHEDSKLISGDLPALARAYLQENVLGNECPVLCHTGPEGNQSPRHVTHANTFAEASRLGQILGRAVEKVIPGIDFSDDLSLFAAQTFVELPPRAFPSVTEAEEKLRGAVQKLNHLRTTGAAQTDVRTAECDWFGAEETSTLAKAAQDGQLDEIRKAVMPAEVQVIGVGQWRFVCWPGEMFVEYDLAVKAACEDTFVIALANGELQGYIVTPEAAAEGGYEASNALFAAESGQLLVEAALSLVSSQDAESLR